VSDKKRRKQKDQIKRGGGRRGRGY